MFSLVRQDNGGHAQTLCSLDHNVGEEFEWVDVK